MKKIIQNLVFRVVIHSGSIRANTNSFRDTINSYFSWRTPDTKKIFFKVIK